MFHCTDWYMPTFRDNLSLRSTRINQQRHTFWTAWSVTMGPKSCPSKLVKKTSNLRRVKALKSDKFIQNSAEVWNYKWLEVNSYFPDITPYNKWEIKGFGRAATATGLRLDDRRSIAQFPAKKSGLLVLENVQNATGAHPGSFTRFASVVLQ